MRAWRTAHASAAGTSHVRAGTPCQDHGACALIPAAAGGEILVACVADGAGSAARSAEGARMAVGSFQQAFAAAAADSPGLDSPGVDGLWRDFVLRWLAGLQAAIADAAAAAGAEAKDYACTLLGAVIGDAAALYVQIGDGAIVVAPDRMGEDRQEAVFWPQHGEFANSTFFVTMEDAADIIQVERRATPPGGVRDLAMFSDGLERLILDMTARTVHAPALRSIFGWLAATAPAVSDASSPVLAAFLDSANVNRRTDDDKTLIVATRAAPAKPAEP